MDIELQKAHIASTIIESYYNKLREMTFLNDEENPEYNSIINKLKKAVIGEEQIYDEISDDKIINMINYLNKKEKKNNAELRMYSRLNHAYHKHHNKEFNIELSNIITSKIIIDVLKMVTLKIIKLSENNISEEFIEALLTYHHIYKYTYLTSNSFIEKLSLQYEFDILGLPNIEFSEVEKAFSTKFIEESGNITLEYIKSSIQELLSIRTEDKTLETYITLFEVSRIEVMLPYLSKNMLEKLSIYLNSLNISNDNTAFKKIKKIINKRKEELE